MKLDLTLGNILTVGTGIAIVTGLVLGAQEIALSYERLEGRVNSLEREVATTLESLERNFNHFVVEERRSDEQWEDGEDAHFQQLKEILFDLKSDHRLLLLLEIVKDDHPELLETLERQLPEIYEPLPLVPTDRHPE